MMRLSVVMATLDRADTLGGQLEALCRQEWPQGWEVVVADNGSRDGTRDVVDSYAGRLPDLQVIDASQRPGSGHALNEGVRSATGDALLFVDDDDEVGEGWLRAMGGALLEHSFVACRIDPDKLNPPWLAESRGRHQWHELMRLPYPPYLPHAAGATLGVRRSVFEAVGGFDETLLAVHDTYFCIRAQLAGAPLHFVPDAVVHMRFRRTIPGMYRQAKTYGEYSTLLYRKMRDLGTPPLPRPIHGGLAAWRDLARGLPSVRHPGPRARWVFGLGYRIGRLRGSLKHGVLAP